MKIRAFLRRSLPLLCAALLLVSLFPPVQASAVSTNETLYNAISEQIDSLYTAQASCWDQGTRLFAQTSSFIVFVNDLASDLDVLDGQSADPLSTISFDDSGYDCTKPGGSNLIEEVLLRLDVLEASQEMCCERNLLVRSALLEAWNRYVDLYQRFEVLKTGSSSTEFSPPKFPDGSYTPYEVPSADTSIAEHMQIRVVNATSACTACRKMSDVLFSFYSSFQSQLTNLSDEIRSYSSGDKLSAPEISISGDILTIVYSSDDVPSWAIYVDDELVATVARDSVATQYDLSQLDLASGDYVISVAGCSGQTILTDESDVVSYTVSAEDLSAPKISISGDRLSISYSGDDSVTLFAIYVDGELSTTVLRTGSLTDFSLSDLALSSGIYTISVAGGQAQTVLTAVSNSLSYVCSSELTLPAMEISDSILSLTCSNPFVTQYRIYIDDELKVTIPKSGVITQYDLRQLGLSDGKKYWVTVSSGNSDDEFSVISGEADVFVVWNLTGSVLYVFTGKMFDRTGDVCYGSYAFSGEDPAFITLIVASDSVTVQYGVLSQGWPVDDGFLGLYDSNGVFYGVGGTYTISSSSDDHTLKLDFYTSFAGSSASGSVDFSAYSGFGSFIVSVLGAFLSFSILPGVSFGGLLSICLIIAIVKLFFS